jgi:hypothetical protein
MGISRWRKLGGRKVSGTHKDYPDWVGWTGPQARVVRGLYHMPVSLHMQSPPQDRYRNKNGSSWMSVAGVERSEPPESNGLGSSLLVPRIWHGSKRGMVQFSWIR